MEDTMKEDHWNKMHPFFQGKCVGIMIATKAFMKTKNLDELKNIESEMQYLSESIYHDFLLTSKKKNG